ncbi:MAG: caspase family protein [Bacteroidales bacterium]|nr:caspase family protein [Bacteroidales bacterium]
MRHLLVCIFFIISISLHSQIKEKRLALIIGNTEYHFAKKLLDPADNIDSLEAILKQIGFVVLKYKNLEQRQMKEAINNFAAQLHNYDVGFFYYAGHATRFNGANYLIPTRTHLEKEMDIELECVSFNRLIGEMEAADVQTNILILDAYQPDAFDYLKKDKESKGLAFINGPGNFFIAFSSRPGEISFDNKRVTSQYTSELLKNIGRADIQIEDVFKAIRRRMFDLTKGKQMPWETSSGVYFRFNPVN